MDWALKLVVVLNVMLFKAILADKVNLFDLLREWNSLMAYRDLVCFCRAVLATFCEWKRCLVIIIFNMII